MSTNRTPEVKAFIRKNAHLFWYIPDEKKENISDETLVEFILNYGTLEDVKEMKTLLGNKYIYEILSGLEGRKKGNYYPEIYNLFYLHFKRYA